MCTISLVYIFFKSAIWKMVMCSAYRQQQTFPRVGGKAWESGTSSLAYPTAKAPRSHFSFEDFRLTLIPSLPVWIYILEQEGRDGWKSPASDSMAGSLRSPEAGLDARESRMPTPDSPRASAGPALPYHIGKNSCKHTSVTSHWQVHVNK